MTAFLCHLVLRQVESEVYLQLEVDESSKELLTLTTHQGPSRPTQLQYDVSPAPAQFQAALDLIPARIPGALCYLDDVLCAGKAKETHHWKLVEEILKRVVSPEQ